MTEPVRGVHGVGQKRHLPTPSVSEEASSKKLHFQGVKLGNDSIPLVGDFKSEEIQRVQKLFESAVKAVGELDLGEKKDTNPAFSHRMRDGKVVVYIPATIEDIKSPVANMILALSILFNECVELARATKVEEGDEVLSDPDKAFINGIHAILSFANGEGITLAAGTAADIETYTRRAICHLAATRLAQDKTARGVIRPFVLRSNPVNGQAPGSYLSGRFDSLGKSLGARAYMAKTLFALVKIAAEKIAPFTANHILNIKIPWNAVLIDSSLGKYVTERPRGKPPYRKFVSTAPLNVSANAYVLPEEKPHLSKLYKEVWGSLDKQAQEWSKLPAPEQHKQYESMVKTMTEVQKRMHQLTDTVGRRLGHRKMIIDKIIKDNGIDVKKVNTAVDRVRAAATKPDAFKTIDKESKWKLSPFYVLGQYDAECNRLIILMKDSDKSPSTTLEPEIGKDDSPSYQARIALAWIRLCGVKKEEIVADPLPKEAVRQNKFEGLNPDDQGKPKEMDTGA